MVGSVIMEFPKSMNNNWMVKEYIKLVKYRIWKWVEFSGREEGKELLWYESYII